VFGDGSHATTRLCAGAVDSLARQHPGAAVLDVGTGTGVLARIARARGASFVAGTDIDVLALETARSNESLDAATTPLHLCSELPDHWGARFDLVVANILAEPLVALAPRLARALRDRGQLVISGFTAPQGPALRRELASTGLACLREAHLDGWMLLMFRREGNVA
jgi:ribosomal protein L11 methyltransferase